LENLITKILIYMKVYFYSNNPAEAKENKEIIRYLKRAGVTVGSNLSGQTEMKNKLDALIVQGKKLDAKASYLMALTLSQGKDVLCLLPKGVKADEALSGLQSDDNFGQKLHLKFYQPDGLLDQVISFIKSLDQDSLRDLANIKYTLRLSSKISDYLNWKAKIKKMRKADWLRQQINQIMDNDTQYKKFLEDKFDIVEDK